MPAFVANPPECVISTTLTTEPSSAFINFDLQSNQLLIQSNELAFAGGTAPPFSKDYALTLTGTSSAATLS